MDSRFSQIPLKKMIAAGFHIALIVMGISHRRNLAIATKHKNFARSSMALACAFVRDYIAQAKAMLLQIFRLEHQQSVQEIARENKIPIIRVNNKLDKTFEEKLRAYEPDLICIASFNRLLKKNIIRIPKYGVINFHPSLLPYYPGPCPWFKMIMREEKNWGATIHYVDEGEDTGDIIYQSKIDYSEEDNGKVLFDKTIEIGAELMLRAVKDILADNVKSYRQSEVADRFRSPRPKFDDLLISLKPAAKQNCQFLNRLLFFEKPIIKYEDRYYKIIKILSYKSEKLSMYVKKSRRLFSDILECHFEDGLIVLKVTQVKHGNEKVES